MTEGLVIVKQLPVIEERLKSFQAQIETEVSKATMLACTEETVKSVKEARARLNSMYSALDRQRIDIKRQILAPYEHFEEAYKEYVAKPFRTGDAQLKSSIDNVENALRAEKEEAVVEYYDEYARSKAIDFVPFERSNINITLSATLKKLKESVTAFLDGIEKDLELINTQEHSTEILVEYKRTLDVSGAIVAVTRRYEEIERERQKEEQAKADADAKSAAEEKVEAVIAEAEETEPEQLAFAPPQVEAEERIYEVHFTVHGTKEQMRALKTFLNDGGYIYE